jgi:hypothetical protein
MKINIDNDLELDKPFFYIEYLHRISDNNREIIINDYIIHEIERLDYIKIMDRFKKNEIKVYCVQTIFIYNNYEDHNYEIENCFATKDKAIEAGNNHLNTIKVNNNK